MSFLALLSLLGMVRAYAVMQAARAWLGLRSLPGLAHGIFLQLFSLGSGGLWLPLWVDEKVARDETDLATGPVKNLHRHPACVWREAPGE